MLSACELIHYFSRAHVHVSPVLPVLPVVPIFFRYVLIWHHTYQSQLTRQKSQNAATTHKKIDKTAVALLACPFRRVYCCSMSVAACTEAMCSATLESVVASIPAPAVWCVCVCECVCVCVCLSVCVCVCVCVRERVCVCVQNNAGDECPWMRTTSTPLLLAMFDFQWSACPCTMLLSCKILHTQTHTFAHIHTHDVRSKKISTRT